MKLLEVLFCFLRPGQPLARGCLGHRGEEDLNFFMVHLEGKLCQLYFSKLSWFSLKFMV